MAEQHHHPKLTESAVLRGPVRAGERTRLRCVLVLTGLTMVAEFVGAALTGSLSLLGDAFHMLTHFAAIAMSFFAIVIATRPAPPDKTYRYWRAEVIASLVNGIALVPIALFILYKAWDRWRHPADIEVAGMLGIGAIGLVVNIVSAAFLHRHSKHDLNVRGAFLHMVADTASSVGVIAAGLLIWLTGWKPADPLAAALISVLILVWSVGLCRDSIRILLESAPKHLKLEDIRDRMKAVDGIAEVHDLHVWTITSNMIALTAHVILKEDAPVSRTEEMCHMLQRLLDGEFDITHVTLQFETAHASTPCEHEHEPAGGHAD